MELLFIFLVKGALQHAQSQVTVDHVLQYFDEKILKNPASDLNNSSKKTPSGHNENEVTHTSPLDDSEYNTIVDSSPLPNTDDDANLENFAEPPEKKLCLEDLSPQKIHIVRKLDIQFLL